jgi:LmbE family N-acetylglucosaminyl deacetylase
MFPLLLGNHYGLGARRKIEQKNSCTIFGVLADNCKVLDVPELQDDPVAVWPNDKIQTILADHVNEWRIDAVSFAFRSFNILNISVASS